MDLSWIASNAPTIASYTVSHLVYTLLPTLIALIISIPLGTLAYRCHRIRLLIINISSILYTIPSLALFVLLPSILGTRILDPLNVIVALTVYSVALMVREVVAGLESVPTDVLQEADAMGMTALQKFFQVQLPVAFPVLFGALRVVVVSNISIVTVAAVVGMQQLGTLFTDGLTRRMYIPIFTGLVLCLLLSLVLDQIINLLGKLATPWERGR